MAFPSPFSREPAAERRREPRARVSVPVTLTIGTSLVEALATDVAPRGMRLVSARPVDVGATVEVAFLLEGNMVCGRGIVRWCTPAEGGAVAFGMVFTALDDDGAEVVAAFASST